MEVEKVVSFYIGEMEDYLLYRELSERAKGELCQKLREIAEMEREHALFWKKVLTRAGVNPPEVKELSAGKKLIVLLSKVINPALLISLLETGESGTVKEYFSFLNEGSLPAEERTHLRRIILDEIEHETFFSEEAKNLGLSNVRDFVLGMNDGLVEILGTVTGLSAVYPDKPFLVAVSGSVVGVAGALSMGIGAFVSVRSQKQVNQALREKLKILSEVAPEKAKVKLKEELIERGLPEEVAERLIKEEDIKNLIQIITAGGEESELRSALFTGSAYILGVLFPVLPFFIFPSSLVALPVSLLLAGGVLSGVGGLIALFSGIDTKKKAGEMLGAGLSAAGLSFLFGKLLQSFTGIGL